MLLRRPPLYLIVSIIMASGGILNGLDIGIISPVSAMSSFRNSIASTSSTIHGLVVSSILLPAALTSLFAGRLADALGRPRAVFIGSFVFGLGAALEAGAVHLAMFLVGRVISGAGEGLFLSVTVVYISELSPPDMRGFLTGMVQFVTTVGILLGYFIAYATVHYESSASWRAPLAVLAGCAILFAAASLTLPQSPRWMLLHGQHEEARKLCERLGVPKLEQVLSNQSAILSHEKQAAETQKVEEIENPVISRSLMRAFRKDVRGRTALGIFTQAMSQLSGIDSVLYYAPQIFQQTGLVNDTQSFLTSGVQAIVIVAVTVPGLILADRWKRRTSTILGGSLLAGCMILIGSLYASHSVHQHSGISRWIAIVTKYIYIVSYCVTWGVCLRGYPTEIQPPVTRAAASSLAQSVNWVTSFIVSLVVPVFFAHSSFGPYYLFGFVTLFNVVVCALVLPETRGQTLEDIDRSRRRRTRISN